MGIMASMLTGSALGEKTGTTVTANVEGPTGDDVSKVTDNCEPSPDLPLPSDQCGLENDGIAWVPVEPPKRKRVCEATPEMQAKLTLMLETIFSPVHSLLNRRVPFHPNDLCDVLIEVKPYLASEPVFIEDVEAPITIVGDLHGQLHDLHKIFTFHSKDGKPGYECGRFLFLGNYVQRGRQSLEIVVVLFILKILYPSEFFLLRGNHEFIKNNKDDLALEFKARFMLDTARFLFYSFNAAFCWLSMCAVVGGKVFCVHGGISANGFTKTSLRNLRKPILESTVSYLVHDLVMSDPAEGLQGTCFNLHRGSSILFGEGAFAVAMDAIDCILMFRGHRRITDGCELTWDRVYTLYSAPDVCQSMNKGSFAQLSEKCRVRIVIMPYDPNRHRLELLLKQGAGDVPKEEEDLGTGTITKIEM